MRVLIIGAKGMLGQAMMDVWSEHDVTGVDLAQLDITKPLEVTRALELYRPSVVINCAAYTAVDKCETDEATADIVNGTAVGYVAKACEAHKIPLVHISTDYIFNGVQTTGYREDDRPDPQNAYGRTKLHGERQLQANTSRFYLVRTSWLYGPGGKNFVQTMLTLGTTKPELKVVDDQHGTPTYTYDLAIFIRDLVIDRAPYGIYHGTNEQPTTWYEFAKEIFRQASMTTPVKPCSSAEYPLPAKRPAWSILLNTKRPPLRPWPAALRDYLLKLGYSENV